MKEIAVIGVGTMGSAICDLLQDEYAVRGFGRQDHLAAVEGSDIAIVAVKPQSFMVLAEELRPHVDRQTIVSIMAGISICALTESLGTDRIVRTMPNLALKIGQSTTAWYTAEAESINPSTEGILRAWGTAVRLESEKHFDTFTAVAGSGPAYVFELAHQLEQAAVSQGLDKAQARAMIQSMIRGAAALLGDADPQEQVRQVASKGGTTEAGLRVLEVYGFGQMVNEVVAAAAERSRELGS